MQDDGKIIIAIGEIFCRVEDADGDLCPTKVREIPFLLIHC
jgi:hypothetical protein